MDNLKDKIDDLREKDEFLLIVLDACRYDYMKKHWDEYFIGELEKIVTPGLNTFKYMENCWLKIDGKYDVTYVTGVVPINNEKSDTNSSWSIDYSAADHIETVIEAWKYGWDISLGTCTSKAVCDIAIDAAEGTDRMVAHFPQPHAPYIGETKELGHTGDTAKAKPAQAGPADAPVWQRVQSGELSVSRLREAYEYNLFEAIYEVCRLIEYTDFNNIVITADHGEALGERGDFGHGVYNNFVREVPWIEFDELTIEGRNCIDHREVDTGQYESEDSGSVEDKLRALGYIE